MNDWERGDGMCLLHLVCHGWESTGSTVYITVSNAGIDLYLPLYPWIRELILKWLSLFFIMTLDYVFITTSRSRLWEPMTTKTSLWNWRWIFLFCIFKREFWFFLLNEWLRGRGRNVLVASFLSWLRVNRFNRLHNGAEYRYQPLFTIILLNSWINLEKVKFILYFYSGLCVFNDLAVWIRKSPWQQRLLCEIEGGYFSFVYWKENFDFSSWLNDWEGDEGMCQLRHVYHGWESTSSTVKITVPNTGIDLYLPWYSWIRELILKRWSLYFILTLDYVFLTTSRSRLWEPMTTQTSWWNWRWSFLFCILKGEFWFFLLNEWLRGTGRNVWAPSCLSWLRVNGFNHLHNGDEYRYGPLFTIIPLNSWINLQIIKLYWILTLDYVFLTTSRSRFMRAHD